MSTAAGERALGPIRCFITILTFFALAAQCQQGGPTQKPIVQVPSTGAQSTGVPITQKPTEPEPVESSGPKRRPDLPVLGYVTPWNSRGKQLVEDYREKLDLVSPVWYTVHADEAKTDEVYVVKGGPPAKEDEAWYKRLQQPAKSSDAAKPLQIVPRFLLDGWDQENFQNLLFNETRWQLLSDAIMDVVLERSFDGVVFESGASYALGAPLTRLSELLHAKDKLLVLVMPPIRAPGDGMTDSKQAAQHHFSLILHSRLVLTLFVYTEVEKVNMANYRAGKASLKIPGGRNGVSNMKYFSHPSTPRRALTLY